MREKHQPKVQSLKSYIASNATKQKRECGSKNRASGHRFGCSEFEVPVEIAGNDALPALHQ